MSQADIEYAKLAQSVLDNGTEQDDRTGTGTISEFGLQSTYDLSQGFPLLTTKKVFWGGVVDELLWFLKTKRKDYFTPSRLNINELPKRSHNMWSHWAKDDGDLGRMYGAQFRDWTPGPYPTGGIDQIANAIESIKTNPSSRRHIVSAWATHELHDMQLAPCHIMFQFYVANGTLSCKLYQRSADIFLGVPFNIASYALLTHIVAQVCNLKVGKFIHTFGDAHIYKNHLDQIKEQLSRPTDKPAPKLFISPGIQDIDEITAGDIVLLDYDPYPAIKGKVSV